MTVNEIRDFIFQNYYKRTGFSQENSYYSIKRLKKKYSLFLKNKLIEKILDPYNAKEHYQSFIKKRNTKSVKQSEITIYQPKTFENPRIIDIKSVITEPRKTSHKLSKTVRQAEKVDSNSSLNSARKISKNFVNEKLQNQKMLLKSI